MIEKLKEPPKYWLSLDLCEKLYRNLSEYIQYDEPIPAFSSRFKGKLESIVNSVRQTYEDTQLNPTVLDATVAYFYQFIVGHPFQNGNKRMSVCFTHSFLIMNGYDLNISSKNLYRTAVDVIEFSHIYDTDKVKSALRNFFSKIIVKV